MGLLTVIYILVFLVFALILYDNNIFLYIIFYLVNTSIDSIFFHIFK